MSKLQIVISEEAVVDLNDIWLYTFQTWSKEQADRYYNLIYKEIEFLSQNPASGKKQDHIRPGYRSAKVKSHLIFYKIVDEELEVIRILHQNMDIPNHFGD